MKLGVRDHPFGSRQGPQRGVRRDNCEAGDRRLRGALRTSPEMGELGRIAVDTSATGQGSVGRRGRAHAAASLTLSLYGRVVTLRSLRSPATNKINYFCDIFSVGFAPRCLRNLDWRRGPTRKLPAD